MNHLKALLKKNYILMKRNTCGTCCEIVLPIFFACALLLIRSVIKVELVN
jgi:ATP-binding cassette subfamily A (ABC1) protein 3